MITGRRLILKSIQNDVILMQRLMLNSMRRDVIFNNNELKKKKKPRLMLNRIISKKIKNAGCTCTRCSPARVSPRATCNN